MVPIGTGSGESKLRTPMAFPPVRISYKTYEFETCDIHVRSLRDAQQFADPRSRAADLGIYSATWPLFGVVWNSSQILARLMVHHKIEDKRILEVGCGLGLASLVLNHRNADITATDHHPEAEDFLKANIELNKGEKFPFVRADWEDVANDQLGRFDLIIGSDLLYEQNHADLLSQFIERHSKPECEVVIVDPGRGYAAKFNKKMSALGYSQTQTTVEDPSSLNRPFKGRIMRYQVLTSLLG